MTLSIVIPAFNEERSIRQVLEKCESAGRKLGEFYGRINITIVDDGSRDSTGRILDEFRFSGMQVITHEKNMGYGAALARGAAESDSGHIAFLDADGTYDPRELTELARALQSENQDLVIGNRMQSNKGMPRARRAGNIFFTRLLNFICKSRVHDAASGMRIIKRDAFEKLVPLPTGLNFAYIMTARALGAKMRVAEAPISYSERLGASKLNAAKDGLVFLFSILRFAILKK